MKLTDAQARMLRVLADGQSRPVWKLNMESASHGAGYRVIAGLYAAGLIQSPGGRDPSYSITDAGRSALAQTHR